jgi:hypothetical protein
MMSIQIFKMRGYSILLDLEFKHQALTVTFGHWLLDPGSENLVCLNVNLWPQRAFELGLGFCRCSDFADSPELKIYSPPLIPRRMKRSYNYVHVVALQPCRLYT